MTDHEFPRLSRLLDAALDLPESEREQFLRANLAGEERLLGAALAALRADEESKLPLRSELLGVLREAPSADSGDELARLCGPFRLLQRIGAGGMGEVFLAERAAGDFSQRVAVKLLPATLRGRELRQRLERERQILARLEHPGIARLVDGGIADDGSPYLALEYVEGEVLSEYVAHRELALFERLGLFLQICDAVAYAHRRLVIHRDLKPSNVMVGADGRARLLDFGIAKLAEEDDLGLTRTVDRLHTPRYASPEQLRGEPATTATDVYGLGLLLFELVAGARPFGSSTTSELTLTREILEREPPRPTAISRDLAARREGRDLDAISAKALRKIPEERYASVEELAAEVRCMLEGRPVAARGGDRLYRAGRLLRRHALPVAAGVAIFAALALGLVVALRERDKARAAEAKAETVRRFLIDDLLLAATPEVSRGRELTVREVLNLAEGRVSEALSEEPELELGVRGVLADAQLMIGDLEAAERELDRESKLLSVASGVARNDHELRVVKLLLARSNFKEALSTLKRLEGRAGSERASAIQRAQMLLFRGRAEEGLGQFAKAEASYRAAQTASRLEPAGERIEVETLARLSTLFAMERRDLESEAAANEFVGKVAAVYGEGHPMQVLGLARRSMALRRLQRAPEAEAAARSAVELARRVLPHGHEFDLEATRAWIQSLRDLRQFDAARREAEELLSRARSARGPESVAAASAEELRGILHAFDREYERAGALYAHALAILRAELGEVHPTTVRVRRNIVALLRREGKAREARAASERLVELARVQRNRSDLDPTTLRELALLALRAEPAEIRDPKVGFELASRAVALTERGWLDALVTLAEAQEALGDLAAALATTREAFAFPDALLDSSMARTMIRRLHKLGEASAGGEIDAFLAGMAARRRELYPTDDSLESDTLTHLAARDQELGRYEDAVRKLKAADAVLAPLYSETHADRVTTILALVENLRALGETAEARRRLRHLQERLASEPDADPDLREEIETALAELGPPA